MARHTWNSTGKGTDEDHSLKLEETNNTLHTDSGPQDKVSLTSPASTHPNLAPTANESRSDNMFKGIGSNRPKSKSIAAFPYLLEPDKTFNFPFSTEMNKQFTETDMYAPGLFSPKNHPEDNWPGFVKEVWKHLEHYAAEGISPEQYAEMLQPHFSPRVWARIYEEHVSTKTDPASRARACQTVLHVYTLECYKFEARIRDYNRFFRRDNMYEFSESIQTFADKFYKLYGKGGLYMNYMKLLLITRIWSPAERSQFFSIRRCLNSFQAPMYQKITEEILAEAVAQGVQMSEESPRHKRQSTSATGAHYSDKRSKRN